MFTYYLLLYTIKRRIAIFIPLKEERFLGRTLRFQTYEQFFAAWCDVFLERQNYFYTTKKSPVIVDAGANYGMSTLYFKKIYPHAKVFVIEPDPDNLKDLAWNLKGLKDVTIVPFALSDKEGKITFYRDSSRDRTGGSIHKNQTATIKITVQTKRLFSLFPGDIDYLKLDVEGAECDVIRDLSLNNKYTIGYIFLEFHYNQKNQENKLSTILDFLERRGFAYALSANRKPPFTNTEVPYGINIFAFTRKK